jgi:hypothetical protein
MNFFPDLGSFCLWLRLRFCSWKHKKQEKVPVSLHSRYFSCRIRVPGWKKYLDPDQGWENQCCGSELIFFGFGSTNYFFRIRIWIRIRILRLIFLPQIFLNVASNCFHMCSETCTSEKTNFQVFVFWFFTKIFILQQCLNPNPNFSFGFGSSQNIRIISDSDPQHWRKWWDPDQGWENGGIRIWDKTSWIWFTPLCSTVSKTELKRRLTSFI